MTTDEETVAAIIAQALRAAVGPLQKRIAALEARPQLKDAGVWKAGESYTAGDIVSWDGSAWICRVAHVAAGTHPSHDAFRLLVKHR